MKITKAMNVIVDEHHEVIEFLKKLFRDIGYSEVKNTAKIRNNKRTTIC